MSRKPITFIGSSREGLQIAESLQINLAPVADVELWSQGVFELSFSYLESLIREVERVDFAVLVLTADDVTRSRGRQKNSPRDNIIFELGLFMGKLGRQRCYFVYNESDESILKLPTDLLGVSAATYKLHSSGNLEASLGVTATKISRRISALGRRPEFMSLELAHDAKGSDLPSIAGIWEGFSPNSDTPSQKNSTLEITQTGSFVRATVKRITKAGNRIFEYEGRFSAGQIVLFFEELNGRGFIIGSMVLHLSSDLRSLSGKSIYYHHDTNQVVSSDRAYKKIS